MSTPEKDFIDPAVIAQMNFMARLVDGFINDDMANKKNGFVLCLFPLEFEGRFNYMSNIQRHDVIKMLKAMVAKFEATPEPAPEFKQ